MSAVLVELTTVDQGPVWLNPRYVVEVASVLEYDDSDGQLHPVDGLAHVRTDAPGRGYVDRTIAESPSRVAELLNASVVES